MSRAGRTRGWSAAPVGINLGPLLAGAGILGVALGFGSQSLVKDFLSGVFILVEDQFGVGDIVELDGQTAGMVDAVSLRTTRLRAVDGTLWHVPNGEIRRVGDKSRHWSRALSSIAADEQVLVALRRSEVRQGSESGPPRRVGPGFRAADHKEQS